MRSTFDAPRRMPAEVDLTLLWSALVLLLGGMVMVYSASIAIAEVGRFTGNQPAYFLSRHALFLGVSLVAALMAFQVPVSAVSSASRLRISRVFFLEARSTMTTAWSAPPN